MRSIEAYKAQDVMRKLTQTTTPGQAIRELALHPASEEENAFEAYAASVLRKAGALELTAPGKPTMRMKHSAQGEHVLMSIPANPLGGDRRALGVLEDALNRLLRVSSALAEGVGSHIAAASGSASVRRQKKFERYGIAYPLWSDPSPGAQVILPPPSCADPGSAAYYNEVDWRVLDTVANGAHRYFQSAILANGNQVIFGVKAPPNSEWDVRTRLATSMENLEPPLGLRYRFDCDLGRNTACLHFSAPPLESFPAILDDEGTRGESAAQGPPSTRGMRDAQGPPCAQGMRDARGDDLAKRARVVYCLRLAAFLAAVCFGSGRSVEQAFIVGKDGDTPIVSCAFERRPFVYETMPAIDAQKIAAPHARFDPDLMASMLSANRAEYFIDTPASLPEGRLAVVRAQPARDTRELPCDMQWLFRAKRACDLDTSGYIGQGGPIIDEARQDADTSAVAAIAQLERIVADEQARLRPPGDEPDSRPLYCENALARVAMALLDDDLNIAEEAEAFLSFEDDVPAERLPGVYYFRAPDALFHAHIGLADLYRNLGDAKGEEYHADRCMELAPTTVAAYAMKADALTRRGLASQAANVLQAGLRIALGDNDRAMLLYDLGRLLMHANRKHEAAALFIYVSTLSGIYADKARTQVDRFSGEENARSFSYAHLPDATKVMKDMGLSLVSERVRHALIARAALGLANAHMPNVAAPYTAMLSAYFQTNRTVIAACNSIQFGLGD